MKTALVIDNSKLMRSVIKCILEEEGIKIVGEAANAQEAIHAYENLRPDLVTLDSAIPGGSGMDLLKSIITRNAAAEVLMIIDADQNDIEHQALQIGARAIIHKPISNEEFKRTLEKITPHRNRTSKHRVLVVDDSMVMRAMIKAMLEEQGMEIIGEAGDVQEGIKAFEELKPDLMTLDLIMPGGSGLDVLRAIMPQNPNARVVVITAVNQTQIEHEALQLGACAIINKPLTDDVVKTALGKALAPVSNNQSNNQSAAPTTLSPERIQAVQALFQSGANKCAQAMSTMCKNSWASLEIHLGNGTAQECASMITDSKISESLTIRMTVAEDIPMTALLLASEQGAQNIARLLSRNKPERIDREVVKLVWMEWSNIIITAVLNVFSDSIGSAILSSTPDFVEGKVEEIVRRAATELGGSSESLFIAQTSFLCKSLKADCKTIFMLRLASVEKLVPSIS